MKKSSKDFFQSIAEYPHNIGVYLTYTLDKQVIDKLSEVSTGTIFILHDYKQGVTIDDNSNSTIACVPVNTLRPNENNCFHSKLALLKSEVGAKIIIGSANLSVDSFVTEKEIALELELLFENPLDVFVYNQIIHFFNQLESQFAIPNKFWESTLQKLRFNELPHKEGHLQFIYNSNNTSIFDEYNNYLSKFKGGQKAKRIKIATPFVSEEYQHIEALKTITKDISIYLRKGSRIKPFENHQFKIYQPSTKKREGFHSKIFLTEYNSNAVLLIGSANFTQQGFFNSLNGFANQECGIIVTVSLQEMQEWFNNDIWKQLSENDIKNYVESEDNSLEYLESKISHYAWAERVNSDITTFIFNPNNLPVRKSKGSSKMRLDKVNDYFIFKTTDLKTTNNKITFCIGDEICSVSVLEFSEYINGLNEKGESIFEGFKGIYSINPAELDDAIDKQKLSVSNTSGITITEPPKLEQYYYNVKNLLQSLAQRKYFSHFNEAEIQKEINRTDDGRTLYLTLQLLKILGSKANTENIKKECVNRISELSKKLNIDSKKLNIFIKGWLTSKI